MYFSFKIVCLRADTETMANVFLKNTATRWQSNSLDLQSAYIVLSAHTMDQIKNWQVYLDEGDEQWMNILECPLIVDLLRNGGEPKTESVEIPKEFFNPAAHVEVPKKELAKSVAADENAPVVVPAAEVQQYADKRMHPRFAIRLRVIIKSGKHTFLTYTHDVSLGGLNLINDVPDYIYNAEAEIYITAPDQKNNLKLICSPVPSKMGKSRLMFTKVEESKQQILAAWLHHVVKPNATKVTRSS